MKDIVAKIDLFSGDICYGSVKPRIMYLPTEDLFSCFLDIAAQVSYRYYLVATYDGDI